MPLPTIESGFTKASDENIPFVDPEMITSYLLSNPDFVSSEMRGAKNRT